jgi:hypothetical protein
MERYARVVTVALVCALPCALAGQSLQEEPSMRTAITIRIGEATFPATLADNATATAFEKLLPLSITMAELNGNEKFARLRRAVPAHASTPPSIRTGDLMLYGSDTLVLFYKSFSTTYSYTKIGQVDDPAGLEAALGSGNIAVTFEAKQQKKGNQMP